MSPIGGSGVALSFGAGSSIFSDFGSGFCAARTSGSDSGAGSVAFDGAGGKSSGCSSRGSSAGSSDLARFFLPLPFDGGSLTGTVAGVSAAVAVVPAVAPAAAATGCCTLAPLPPASPTSAAMSALARWCCAGLTAPSVSRMNACSSSESGLMRLTWSK